MNTQKFNHSRKIAADPRLYRKQLGLTQAEFWRPIGVHQAVGSRYEAGRVIPSPVQLLLELAYADMSVAENLLNGIRHPQPGAAARANRSRRVSADTAARSAE